MDKSPAKRGYFFEQMDFFLTLRLLPALVHAHPEDCAQVARPWNKAGRLSAEGDFCPLHAFIFKTCSFTTTCFFTQVKALLPSQRSLRHIFYVFLSTLFKWGCAGRGTIFSCGERFAGVQSHSLPPPSPQPPSPFNPPPLLSQMPEKQIIGDHLHSREKCAEPTGITVVHVSVGSDSVTKGLMSNDGFYLRVTFAPRGWTNRASYCVCLTDGACVCVCLTDGACVFMSVHLCERVHVRWCVCLKVCVCLCERCYWLIFVRIYFFLHIRNVTFFVHFLIIIFSGWWSFFCANGLWQVLWFVGPYYVIMHSALRVYHPHLLPAVWFVHFCRNIMKTKTTIEIIQQVKNTYKNIIQTKWQIYKSL
jgi:hypothetical protein